MEATKASLRREFREARLGFARNSGASARAKLETNIRRVISEVVAPGTQIGLYRPRPEEAAFDLGTPSQYYFPRLVGEEIQFLRPHKTVFVKNQYDIEEPDPETSVPIELQKPMLIFTPAVAVDAQGGRLGMGRGYYDRFFALHPHALRVGVVFQIQVSRTPLPADRWDQPLDWIVTETMILRTSTRS